MLALLLLAAPQFGPRVPLTDEFDGTVSQILADDWNGDGIDDAIVVANADPIVYLSEGPGVHGPSLRPLELTRYLASTDVDGDGYADALIVNDTGAGTDFRLQLNDGTGGFGAATTLFTLDGAGGVVTPADLDGDGDPDLVCVTLPFFPTNRAVLRVSRNLGSGVFGAPELVDPNDAPAFAAVPIDVDGDGDLDLAVNPLTGVADVWYSNDGASFSGPFPIPPVSGAFFAAADIDGDGIDDLVSKGGANVLAWQRNIPGGTIASAVTIGTSLGSLTSTQILDVDGDGDLDVFALDSPDDAVWFENDSAGGFALPQPLAEFDGRDPRWTATGDFDGDGRPDIVYGSTDREVAWARNLGAQAAPHFASPLSLAAPGGDVERFLAVDLGGQGLLDVVSSTSPDREVVAAFGDPATGLRRTTTVAGPLAASLEHADAGDIDSDGDEDLLVVADGLRLLRNEGGTLVDGGSLSPDSPTAVFVDDVDGDGDDDVVVVRGTQVVEVRWLEQDSGTLLAEATLFSLANPVGEPLRMAEIAIEDFDADGTPDMVALVGRSQAAPGDARLTFHRGLGGGAFGPEQLLRTEPFFNRMTLLRVADFDGDGDLDPVVYTSFPVRTIEAQPNLGGGAFGPVRPLVTGPLLVGGYAFDDIDLDGDLDLVVAASDVLGVFPGIGAGVFGPLDVIDAASFGGYGSLTIGDFDGDGDTDVAGVDSEPFFRRNELIGAVGDVECTGIANSTGDRGLLDGFGSTVVALNRLELRASQLPANAFGFFLASTTPGNSVVPGGGVLCLGGAIGRYVGPGQVLNSGPAGAFALDLDLQAIPQPTGFVAAMAGQTWRFQGWHRDVVGGAVTSNLTDGLAVLFR